MQINNQSNANFGMALKVKPASREYLEKLSQNELDQLKTLGNELKKHKFWDVVVDEGGASIKSQKYADRYSGDIYLSNAAFSETSLEYTKDGSKTKMPLMHIDKLSEEALGSVNSETKFPRLGRIVNLMEQNSLKREEKELAEKAAKDLKSNKINNLILDFDV